MNRQEHIVGQAIIKSIMGESTQNEEDKLTIGTLVRYRMFCKICDKITDSRKASMVEIKTKSSMHWGLFCGIDCSLSLKEEGFTPGFLTSFRRVHAVDLYSKARPENLPSVRFAKRGNKTPKPILVPYSGEQIGMSGTGQYLRLSIRPVLDSWQWEIRNNAGEVLEKGVRGTLELARKTANTAWKKLKEASK